MKCWHCGSEMIWDSDCDYSEIGREGKGTVSFFHCSGCKAVAEVFLREDE